MPPRHVYGPVPSRRFGLSLGVDPVPHKVCPYDCNYCQVGPTTRCSARREQFFPPAEILADVEAALVAGPRPDVLTLAGSGEPTLYAGLGSLLLELKRLAPWAPLVLISNGALFSDPQLVEEVQAADLLVPSLDAGDRQTWEAINHPAPELDFQQMLDGLRRVTARHPRVRMEVMLCAGVNDDDASLAAIARQLQGMRLEAVEINSPVRPVAARGVAPCSEARLAAAEAAFGPRAHRIGRYVGRDAESGAAAVERMRQLLGTLARRPSTQEDLRRALGLPAGELAELLEAALAHGTVDAQEREAATYYLLRGAPDGEGEAARQG